MRLFVVPFVAGLLGGGIGAYAANRWIPAGRSPLVTPSGESGAIDALREQLREWKADFGRPRELAAPAPATTVRPGSRAGQESDGSGIGATVNGRSSPEFEAAIERAVAAGIDAARKQDPAAFAPPKAEPKKKVPLAEVARELSLSSSQEDEIRRAYGESTDKMLKLFAEPESTPEALRRELDEAKGDSAKRAGLMVKYIPKMLGKFGEVMAVQAERDQRIHKALGADNVSKFAKFKIAEEDPFGMDGTDLTVSADVGGR